MIFVKFVKMRREIKIKVDINEIEKIKIEIKHEINDNVLTKNKIKDVRFTQYDIVEQ